ncbi:MAG: hypothetical protein NUV67_03460 [archaeon]|nr:hypothetical protein [archaeon]
MPVKSVDFLYNKRIKILGDLMRNPIHRPNRRKEIAPESNMYNGPTKVFTRPLAKSILYPALPAQDNLKRPKPTRLATATKMDGSGVIEGHYLGRRKTDKK